MNADPGKEEKSAVGSAHRAGANKLCSRVKGVREGILVGIIELGTPDRYLFPDSSRE